MVCRPPSIARSGFFFLFSLSRISSAHVFRGRTGTLELPLRLQFVPVLFHPIVQHVPTPRSRVTERHCRRGIGLARQSCEQRRVLLLASVLDLLPLGAQRSQLPRVAGLRRRQLVFDCQESLHRLQVRRFLAAMLRECVWRYAAILENSARPAGKIRVETHSSPRLHICWTETRKSAFPSSTRKLPGPGLAPPHRLHTPGGFLLRFFWVICAGKQARRGPVCNQCATPRLQRAG